MMSNTLHSIKVKLKSKPLISTKDREQLNHAYTVVVTGLETTLRIANQVAGNPGPPGLKAAGISSLLFALDAVKVNALILSIAPTDSLLRKWHRMCRMLSNYVVMHIGGLIMTLQSSKDAGMLSKAIIDCLDGLLIIT